MTGLETLARPLAQRLANLSVRTDSSSPYTEPDIAQNVIEAAGDALDRGETHYTDRPGIPELRGLVADKLNARYGLTYKPGEVTITCGATEARFCAIHVLAGAGVAVICPGDATLIADVVKLAGGRLVKSGTDEPTGSVLYLTPADDTAQWLDQAAKKGWWVVWDVTGAPVSATHPAQQAALVGRVVMIDDLEEAMPGWRVGWMAGSEMADKLRAYKQSLTICTTSVSQWAGMGVAEK